MFFRNPRISISASILVLSFVLAACGDTTVPENTTNDSPKKGGSISQAKVVSIYSSRCALCHGKDGALGLSGAKELGESEMTRAEKINIITNGKNQMMPFKSLLSEEEIAAVAEYLDTFKK